MFTITAMNLVQWQLKKIIAKLTNNNNKEANINIVTNNNNKNVNYDYNNNRRTVFFVQLQRNLGRKKAEK